MREAKLEPAVTAAPVSVERFASDQVAAAKMAASLSNDSAEEERRLRGDGLYWAFRQAEVNCGQVSPAAIIKDARAYEAYIRGEPAKKD